MRPSKQTSILLAIIGSACIIGFALWQGGVFSFPSTTSTKKARGGNWKQDLSVVPSIATSTLRWDIHAAGDPSMASTTTDYISRELLSAYVLAQREKGETTLTEADAAVIANKAYLQASVQNEIPYTSKDIHTSSNTKEAYNAYFTKFNALITTFNKNNTINVSVLTAQALNSEDRSILAPLQNASALYKTLEKDLLLIPTPPGIAPLHLKLVQAYTDVRFAIDGMYAIFDDPVRGIVAIKQYEIGLQNLLVVAEEYRNFKPKY